MIPRPPSVLFVLFTLLAVIIPASNGEEQLFRSNPMGMSLEKIDPSRKSEYEYTLSVSDLSYGQVSRLNHGGGELKRWERSYQSNGSIKEEKEFTEGEISARRIYSTEGMLQEEVSYEQGVPIRRTVYDYERRRLEVLEQFDGSGVSLFREKYAYTARGLLRKVIRTYPNGEVRLSSFVFVKEGLSEVRTQRGGELIINRYDGGGRLNIMERWENGKLIIIKKWVYHENSRVVRSIEESNLTDKYRVTQMFDPNGRILSEQKEGTVQENIQYMRNSEGQLVRKIKIGPVGREETAFEYTSDGEVRKESFYRKGWLEKTRIYTGDNLWYEEIYRDGSVFLRVYYRKGEKVREDFIQNGVVVLERIYKEE